MERTRYIPSFWMYLAEFEPDVYKAAWPEPPQREFGEVPADLDDVHPEKSVLKRRRIAVGYVKSCAPHTLADYTRLYCAPKIEDFEPEAQVSSPGIFATA